MTMVKVNGFSYSGMTMGLCLSLALLLTTKASASVITSLPGGTVVAMPALNYIGGDPQVFGPGITWTTTNSVTQGGSVFGYTGPYDFASNGNWNGLSMAGINSASDTMTFAFSSPLSAVGGFLNYAPGYGTPLIAVFDSGGNLIEDYNPTFMTGGGTNTGSFLGFQAASNNISYFKLSNAYISLTDLTILSGVTTVPEPSSLALAGLGAIGFVVGVIRRRRQARTAA